MLHIKHFYYILVDLMINNIVKYIRRPVRTVTKLRLNNIVHYNISSGVIYLVLLLL